MKTKQVLGIVTALIIFSLVGVYAQEEGIATGEFSLLAWFQHTFGIEPFTVVGDTRSCGTPGGNWNYAWSVAAGKHLSGVDGILSGTVGSCPDNAGLYNIYTNGGTRYVETKSLLNPVNWVCGTGPCIIQLYCCPQPEPTQPGNCVFPRVFRTIDCSDNPVVRGSRTFYWCESPSGELEGNMPYFYNHYNYCTVMATRYCWYRNGNYCSNRLYDRTVFPEECEEYTYDDRLLYTDPDDCESELGSCVVDLECTSDRHCSGGTCVLDSPPTCTSFTYSNWGSCVNGWQTRTITSQQPNGCTGGNPQSLGRTCDGGGGLCGNGVVNSGEQCDGSNLNGATCQTRGFDSGTLSCTSSCTFNTNQCSDDDGDGDCSPACSDGEECSNGQCIQIQEDERTLLGRIQIYDLTYGDAITGESIDIFKPGQQVKVNFKVRADRVWVLQNSYLTEVGIIPLSTAEIWRMNQPSGGFSIFQTFVVGESEGDACCLGQPNFADSLSGNQPSFPRFLSDEITEFSFNLQVPNEATTDLCGSETYWDGTTEYVLYVTVKNGCYKDGYRRNVFIAENIQVNANESTTLGEECNDNFDCETGETCKDIKGDWSFKKYCVGGGTTGGNSLIGAKKLSLTKEEITKSTTPQLLASACKFDSECLDREDIKGDSFSTSCNSLANLRQEGTLSQSDEDEFMTSGKSMVTTGIIGGALGGTIGLVLCALGIGAAEVATGGTATPILIPATATCASLVGSGALLGAGVTVGGTLAWDQLRSDDELVEAFKSNDASSVGICTAEKGFDLSGIIEKLAFFNITGNPLWDGLIILGGILVILYIFVGGRKG